MRLHTASLGAHYLPNTATQQNSVGPYRETEHEKACSPLLLTKLWRIFLVLAFSVPCFGQTWSRVLAPSRAIDWSHAGLPATLADGETTTNPWTPPARRLCTTLSPRGGGLDDTGNIQSAVGRCSHGTYVQLSPGTFAISSYLRLGGRYTSGHNYVTVRGSGPMSTSLVFTNSSAGISVGSNQNNAAIILTASPSQGATSVTLTSRPSVAAGDIAWIDQCDAGITGTSCATGSHADTGGLYFCGNDRVCDSNSTGSGTNPSYLQTQMIMVSSVAGTTVHFTPGLYLGNWSTSRTVRLESNLDSYQASGIGLEDFTVVERYRVSRGISFNTAYASWLKGVRIIYMGTSSGNDVTLFQGAKNILVANNYIDNPPDGTINEIFGYGWDGDNLIINNIIEGGTMVGTGHTSGDVLAYNFIHDTWTGQPYGNFQHQAGSSFTLMEGNQMPRMSDDATWGGHQLNTFFRNNFQCWDAPWRGGTAYQALTIEAYARFENAIGNVLGYNQGGTPVCTAYQSAKPPYIFKINGGNAPNNPSDSLVARSLFRWGNYAICTGDVHCRTTSSTAIFDSSQNPTGLTDVAAAYNNLSTPSPTIPASFFTSVSAHTNGGTGLSWWKVCSSWTTFPTNCAKSTTPPFPPVGADVTGGRPDADGHAYDIPAAVAYKNLPIDPAYQVSYKITASTWSHGTETLTVSGLPSGMMGYFQVTGPCSTGSGEAIMTVKTSTTVEYALASNPGSCAGGSVKWPDVRQFDERVYQSDLALMP